MNKFLAAGILLLMAGKAEAHSHPAIDALTHAVEHSLIAAQAWFPYLLGLSLAALCGALLEIRRTRKTGDSRRNK